MNIEQDITTILSEAGPNGLSVKKIAFHVYNMNNQLFSPISYDEVYKKVVAFIKKNSNRKNSLLIAMEKRGHYSINTNYEQYNQLTFDFSDSFAAEEQPESNESSQAEELMLPFD